MAFRNKTKTKLVVDERQTLDAKHNSVLQTFTEGKKNINLLYSELSNINVELSKLNDENSKKPILDIVLQQKIWDVDDKKRKIEEQIYKIENNIDENTYMLKTGKLLSNYYKILDDEKKIASNNENGELPLIILENTSNSNCITLSDKSTMNENLKGINNISGKKRSIYDWFQNDEITNIITPSELIIPVTEKKSTNKKKSVSKKNNALTITSNVEIEQKQEINNKEEINKGENNKGEINKGENNKGENNKGENNNSNNNNTDKEKQSNLVQTKDTILEKYMKYIDKNYININPNEEDMSDTCCKCFVEMLLNNNTGQLICPKCGLVENIIVDSDKPSFKEPPKEMSSFCYKRINHLNEFLAQFQAKETTDIPEDVYNEILMEIKKERITNMALITPKKMRALLKKIKKNDYYEHIPYIINQLNGLPAPVIAPEIEEIIRGMFKEIQIPFEKYCPHKRKNFLSYNYVMYKFFELLELDEYLDCFQLLKSRTKLHQQDEIWKNICKDLNWEFIKSLS